MNAYQESYYKMYCEIWGAEKRIRKVIKKGKEIEAIKAELKEIEDMLEELLQEAVVRGSDEETLM